MLELVVAGASITALLLAATLQRPADGRSTQVLDLTGPPVDPRLADWGAPDLPCPWCGAGTREEDAACPSCGQRFG